MNAKNLIVDRQTESPDVVQNDFSEIKGRVITLGDIHGSDTFKRVMTALKEGDRLVLVGDLMDRGPDSFEVLKTVRKDSRIVAIRGNHEEMFLRYTKTRTKLENSSEGSKRKHIFNWLQTIGGLDDNQIYDLALHKNAINLCEDYLKGKGLPSLTPEDKNDIINAATFIANGGNWAQKITLEKLKPLANYIDKLPYVRKVITKNGPFMVAHADASILSDEDIEEFIKYPTRQLTDDQKAHITWARAQNGSEKQVNPNDNKRKDTSIPTYVGHEIVTLEGTKVFRQESKHYNLDFGAYYAGTLVGVEHPDSVVVFGRFSQNAGQNYKDKFYSQLHELHSYFRKITFDDKDEQSQYETYLKKEGIQFNHDQYSIHYLESHAPLLTPTQNDALINAQNDKSPKTPQDAISLAMDAAIAACGDSDSLGQQKKQTLTTLRILYNENAANSSTLIKTFITVAATARQRQLGFMTADFGATKSAKAFYNALGADTDAQARVHQALLGATSTNAKTPKSLPAISILKTNQFKQYLTEMNIEKQAPYELPPTSPRK